MAQRADRSEAVEGEVISFPSRPRDIAYTPTRSLRRVDPGQIQIRRSGPLGLFENEEDLAHREVMIKDNHLTDEAIHIEANGIRAEVTGVANTLQGSAAILDMVGDTLPNTTLGRLAEDMAALSIARMRDGHYRFQESLTSEQLNLFHNRRR